MTREEATALAAQLAGLERVGGTDVRHAYPERPQDKLFRSDDYVVALEVRGPMGVSTWWLVADPDMARELLA